MSHSTTFRGKRDVVPEPQEFLDPYLDEALQDSILLIQSGELSFMVNGFT